MFTLSAKIRDEKGKKTKSLREKNFLPAVLYGPEIKNSNLKIDLKEFKNIFKEAGESAMIFLKIEGEKQKNLVLIHDVQRDYLTSEPIHVDFFQPKLKEEVEVVCHLVFVGEAPAVKILGGTLVKNISEIKVKALPQNLPKEIKVNIENLKTFEDAILVKDLKIPEDVKILKNPEEIIASVKPVQEIEKELEKPIEEDVAKVEKVEKKKEEAEDQDSGN